MELRSLQAYSYGEKGLVRYTKVMRGVFWRSAVYAQTPVRAQQQEACMISWAVTFFVIALIAAVLGFSGIAGTAVNIAWICAVIGIVLAIVFGVMGRRPPE